MQLAKGLFIIGNYGLQSTKWSWFKQPSSFITSQTDSRGTMRLYCFIIDERKNLLILDVIQIYFMELNNKINISQTLKIKIKKI